MNDNQLKHHVYWIIKTVGKIESYEDFISQPLSNEVMEDINELVNHVKINY